jgi:chromate transporter
MSQELPFQIFVTFLKISFISFGGVISVLPELERMIVTEHHWLSHDAFMQSYVLAQFVPGPNVALCPMLGYRIAGWSGFAAGFLGIYTAPLLIMGTAFVVYRRVRTVESVRRVERALRPLILGLLMSSGAHIFWLQSRGSGGGSAWASRGVALALTATGFLVLLRKRLDPLVVIFASGAVWWALSGARWI